MFAVAVLFLRRPQGWLCQRPCSAQAIASPLRRNSLLSEKQLSEDICKQRSTKVAGKSRGDNECAKDDKERGSAKGTELSTLKDSNKASHRISKYLSGRRCRNISSIIKSALYRQPLANHSDWRSSQAQERVKTVTAKYTSAL